MSVDKLDFDFVKKSKKGFTTYLNEVIQNIKDPVTLAIYVFLDSLPPEWKINRQHLMNHFGIGRDKLGHSLKWLNENYLIEYVQERNSDGTLGKSGIAVRDGISFLEKIVNKQKLDTAILKTSSPVPTALLKNRTPVKPDNGQTAPINNTLLINNKIIKKEPSVDNLKTFIPPSRSTDLASYSLAPTAINASPLLEEFKRSCIK